jgi:hypothetical protein
MRLSVLSLLLAVGAPAQVQEFNSGAGIELKGPWRMHLGDNPAFASPAFDDSAWPEVMVPSDPRDRGPVKLPNMVWYRWHGRLGAAASEALGLFVGLVPNAWEAFVNGRRIGSEGFGPHGPPPIFLLPSQALSIPLDVASPGDEILIALRVYLDAGKRYAYGNHGATLTDGRPPKPPLNYYGVPLPFGLLTAPVLGDVRYIRALAAAVPKRDSYILLGAPGFLIGMSWLYLYSLRREMQELLWFGLTWVWSFLFQLCILLLASRIDAQSLIVFNQIALMLTSYCVTAGLFAFGRGRAPWWLVIPLAVGAIASTTEIPPGYSSSVHFLILCIYPCITLPVGVLLWRRGGVENRMIAASIVEIFLGCVPDFGTDLAIRAGWIAAPQSQDDWIARYRIVGYILNVIVNPLIFSAVLMERFHRTTSQRERLSAEFASAREMQLALIPSQLVCIAGIQFESTYIPAEEVGGDFFQVLPGEDGSVLLVAGDVSGKGLKAAMLVTLIVGMLERRRSNRPGEVLAELNQALMGRCGGGFVTCCCALFRDNRVSLANAGHLPPWRNGKAVEIDSSLPLGISCDLSFSETAIALGAEDRLLFVSDGVPEARNTVGELLGFDGIERLTHLSTGEIAEQARRFGQEDDITVITIRHLTREAHAA